MQKSASALAYANNTLDESIALVVAANATVQDPEVVGTALKTLSMRLRSAETELEEAGLDTEGMAETTATLRKELLALSGVDIMLDDTALKSTYQIMTELAAVWEDMTDVESAAALELIAGKRMANTAASIISNINDANKALEVSKNAAGSATAENEKYLDSIQGRADKLSATYESLSQNVISSDLVKGGFSGLTGILELIDQGVSKFGALPVVIGTATLAMKALFKETNAVSKALTLVEYRTDIPTSDGKSTKSGLKFAPNWNWSLFGKVNVSSFAEGFKSIEDALPTIKNTDELMNEVKKTFKASPEMVSYFSQAIAGADNKLENLNISLPAASDYLTEMNGKSKLAALGTGLLSAGFMALASLILTKVVEAFSNYIHRVEIAMEEAQSFYNEFQSGQDKVESMTASLEELSEKIDELSRKPKLSLVEQKELDDLEQESAELKQQIELQEQMNKVNEQLAKSRAEYAYNEDKVVTGFKTTSGTPMSNGEIGSKYGTTPVTYGVGFGTPETHKTGFTAQSVSRAEYLVELAEKEQEIQAQISEAEEAFLKLENPTENDKNAYNEKIEELEDQLDENAEDMQETLSRLQSTLEIVGSDSDIGKEIIKYMGIAFGKSDENYALNTFIDKIAKSTELTKAQDIIKKIKSGELSGEWAAEALKQAAPKTIAALEEVGVTAEDVILKLSEIDYADLTNAINAAAVQAQIYTNEQLAESFASVSEKVDELGKAYWEQAQNGSISLSTLQNLMTNHENWADMITVENGLIKLNGTLATETAKKYIQAEIDKLKASLATMEAIKESTELLKEQARTLGSMSASAILAQEALSTDDYDRTSTALKTLETLLNSTANGFSHLEEAADAAKEAQEKYNDALKAEGEAAIAAIDKKIDAKKKELEQLEEEYDAEDKLFELQKAKDRYEAAKKNLNTRLYTEDKGWVWVADPTELQESREALEELEREQAREEAKQAIEDEIDALEELKDKWQDSIDNIGKTLEEHETEMATMAEFEKATFEEMAAAAEEYASRVEAAMARANSATASGGSSYGSGSGSGTGGGSNASGTGSSGSSSSNKSPSGTTFASDNWNYSNSTVVRDVLGNSITFGTLKELKSSGYYDNWKEKSASGYYDKNPITKKYAIGARWITQSGPAIVDEEAPELIARHSETGRLTHLEMGDTVFPADMTQRLWDLAATGAFATGMVPQNAVRTNLHQEAFYEKQSAVSSNDVVLTGCTFELNNVTDVDSFFGELNRIANRHRRK